VVLRGHMRRQEFIAIPMAAVALVGPGYGQTVSVSLLVRCIHFVQAMSSVDGSRVARVKLMRGFGLVSLLSGLFMQSVETAGPDGVREQGPILLIRL
jgi:hypothetical protein